MAATLSENQRRILASMGYNPDEAQDASYEEFFGQDQPTVSNPVQEGTIKAKPSVGGVVVRQAATSVAPTAAGFAVGGKVTAAAAPFMGPAALIPGLIAGIGTGFVTQYAQKKAIQKLAPEFAAQLEQDVQERPLVSAAGSLLGSGVIVKPDPKAIIGAGKAIRALTTGARPVQADVQNLVNVGVGAGIPAVQETVEAIRSKDINVRRAAINILGGAIMNNPNIIGRALGGTPNVYSSPDLAVSSNITAKNPLVENAPLQTTRGTDADIPLDDLYAKALETKMNPDVLATKPELTPELARAAAIPELRQKDPVVEANEATIADKKQVNLLSRAKAKSDAEAEQAAAQFNKQDDAKLAYEQELIDADTTLPEKALPAAPKIPLQKETPTLQQKQQYSREMKHGLEQTPEQILQGLEKKGISRTPNQAWLDTMNKLGESRDVTIAADDTLVSATTGKPISGVAFLRNSLGKALAKINPKLEGLDTRPHELFHVFADDLSKGPSKLGQKLIKDGHEIVAQNPEYLKAKESKPDLTPHEFLTQGVGEDVVRRLLKTDNKGKFGNWLQDFWSFAKTKFGKGTTEDYKRLLSNKLLIDAPTNTSELTVAPTDTLEQGESPLAEGEANVSFMGIQPGYEDFKGFPMYNIEKSDLNPKMVKGSTVSRESLEKAGFKVPKSELVKERLASAQLAAEETGWTLDSNIPEFPGIKTEGLSQADTEILTKLGPRKWAFTDRREGSPTKHTTTYVPENASLDEIKQHLSAKAKEIIAGDNLEQTESPLRQEEQSASSLAGSSSPNPLPDISVPVIRSAVEKIANINSPDAIPLAKKFTEFYEHLTDNRGEYINGLIRPLKDAIDLRFNGTNVKTYLTQNNESATKVLNHFKGLPYGTLNAKEQKAVQLISDAINTVNLQAGLRAGITRIDPPNWAEGNLIDVMSRWLNNVSRRFAYHDVMQTPEAEKLLASLGGNDDVRGVMSDVKGIRNKGEEFRAALGSSVRALMLGPLTGIRDYSNNITIGMQHMDSGQVLKSYLDATVKLPKNLAESFKAGVNRENINSLEFGDEGLDKITSLLRRSRDIVADVQGRNWLEQITRATAFGQGKFLGMDNMYQYSKGTLSKQGETFLDTFHPDKNWRTNKTGNLSPDDLRKIGARFTESVQGTYDLRGLPQFVTEGSLSQVLALAKWNVEKGNNFFKHVVTPAVRKGDYRPLIMQTLGMFAQGFAVTKLTELITKRKDKHASIAELAQSSDKEGNKVPTETLFKFLGLSAAAGYAGIYSEMAHSTMDLFYGKNKPQIYHNALAELTSNLIDSMASIKFAIDEGAGPDVVLDAINKALQDNIQIARLASSFIDPEKIEKISRGNKLRDLRTFSRLNDKPIADLTDVPESNDLVNKDVKKFKRTGDINEAAELLPELIKKAVVDAKGDPDRLRANLSSLKKNSYQTMPSPENFPRSFLQYMTFLRETQGEEAARDRLMDFLKQREVNKMKNEMVPSD